MNAVPELFHRLCDDAAVFPPGNAALPEAVRAHFEHRRRAYGPLVGYFVGPANRLDQLAAVTTEHTAPMAISLTLPNGPGQLPAAAARLARLEVVVLGAIETPIPAPMGVNDLADLVAASGIGADVAVWVEVPRSTRRDSIIAGAAAAGYRLELRIGGPAPAIVPDTALLAGAIGAAVAAGVTFKATAGLHRAVRNIDPRTGRPQHGFLNLLPAADTAHAGGGLAAVAAVLALRDRREVADRVRRLDPAVRRTFASFGTRSIVEPVIDLLELALLPAPTPSQGVPA